MSQISIGVKNPKKGWATTAKKARYNVNKETIRIWGSTTDSSQLQLQDSDSIIIKKLKLWQLVQWFMLVTVFIISIMSLLISIYVIALKQRQQREGTHTCADIQELRATMNIFDDRLTQTEDTALVLELQLNRSVSELKEALEYSSITHKNHYQELNNTIFSTIESVRTVSPYSELDLTAGCAAPIISTCVLNHNNVGTPPTSLTCETPEHPLEEPGFRNVNIYCSIDNRFAEINPVTSTLNIYNGEVSCLCNLVALTAPTASPSCKLTIQRCSDTIRLNTTSMR